MANVNTTTFASFVSAFASVSAVEAEDSIKGFAPVLPTDAYRVTVKDAFLNNKFVHGGAQGLTLILGFEDGYDRVFTVFVTNKAGECHFEKNGRKLLLPGMKLANGLSFLVKGKIMNDYVQDLGKAGAKPEKATWNQYGKEQSQTVLKLGFEGATLWVGITCKEKQDAEGKTLKVNEISIIANQNGYTPKEVYNRVKAPMELPSWQNYHKQKATQAFNNAPVDLFD